VSEVGLALREALEYQGQHQHAKAGNTPGDQRAKATGDAAKRLRKRKDARADHGAYDHGRQGPQ
jgi:hypothetical protein